jgi:hypothetical protein
MSRITRTTSTPFVPTLPIEIWFETTPIYRWAVTEEGNDWFFQFSPPKLRIKFKDYNGREYVDDLLKITTPTELVTFMNLNGCPLYVWDARPFRWSDFIRLQEKLKNAMLWPIQKVQQHSEFEQAFNIKGFRIDVTQKDGAYYGTSKRRPHPQDYYRIVALDRLLGQAKYKFCLRCGKPFPLTSRHKRKYCPYPAPCGHAVAQEQYRQRQKSKTAT